MPTYLDLGSRSAGGVLRPGRRHFAARLLRQHAGAHRQQHRALPGDEPRHGAPDPRDRRGLRLRAGPAKSPKRLWLSFDEWNVWYRARDGTATDGQRAAAPQLLEEVYNLEDALLVGGFVNTLLRNSDRVRVACLAQTRQRHRAARDQRDGRAAAEHLLSVCVGAAATRGGACSICASSRRRIRSTRPACRPTSPATIRCRSWTSPRRSTPAAARRRC